MNIEFSTIQKLFVENGLPLTETQYQALDTYGDFLVAYNQNVNLTAITEPMEIWKKHFLDSISPLQWVSIPEHASLVDVGTGAGFPSVPMAIYRRDLRITMLDSLQKRLHFLEQLAEKVALEEWSCIHGRAEEIGNQSEHREQYDYAVSRAVAALPVLCEYCMPFVTVGGYFLALKGPSESADDAEYAIAALGGKLEEEMVYSLCGEERKLVVIRKISQTPTKYPRKSNRIKQKPLISR